MDFISFQACIYPAELSFVDQTFLLGSGCCIAFIQSLCALCWLARQKIDYLFLAEKMALQGTRESNTVQKFDVWNEHAVSHSSGISILFLGTGLGAPNEQR